MERRKTPRHGIRGRVAAPPPAPDVKPMEHAWNKGYPLLKGRALENWVAEMTCLGMTVKRIAKIQGITEQKVIKLRARTMRAYSKVAAETVAEVKQRQLAILENMLEEALIAWEESKNLARYEQGTASAGREQYLSVATGVCARIDRLLGLGEPDTVNRISIGVPIQVAVSVQDAMRGYITGQADDMDSHALGDGRKDKCPALTVTD